jgi:hypothetical protein
MRDGSLSIMTSLFQVHIDPDRFRKKRWQIVGSFAAAAAPDFC